MFTGRYGLRGNRCKVFAPPGSLGRTTRTETVMNKKNPYPTLLAACVTATALAVGTAHAQGAVSSFGHARARQLAELGRLPSAQDVVVRDLINYHRHRLPLPAANAAVALDARFSVNCAQRGDQVWLQVGYTTRSEGDRALAPPCAVALVVDCSGSMAERGKMAQAKRGLQAFVERLRKDDQIALVGFSSEATLRTGLRSKGNGDWLQDAIAGLRPDGNTNLHGGLMLGLDQLLKVEVGNKARRVIVLTDGIANTGVVDAQEIARSVAVRSGDAVEVSTIGLGTDLDVALLQRLAKKNRGLFHFVADEADVAKVFVREADSLLVPVAKRVAIDIELPDALHNVRVFGETAEPTDGHLHIELPDLNAGATGVVMLQATLQGRDRDRSPLEVHASVSFASPLGTRRHQRSRQTVRTKATLLREREPGAIDIQVRKNAAIAVLSRGMRNMAQACDARRWAEAERRLRRARDQAESLYPGEDLDLQRIRDIAAGHQKTLNRYVNRFRDL